MSAIIVLTIFTIVCIVQAWRAHRAGQMEKKNAYLITAVIFLILLGSHSMFNPNI